MPGYKDSMGIKDKIHIVLRGPDGKIKDERLQRKPIKKTEVRNVRDEARIRSGNTQQDGDKG